LLLRSAPIIPFHISNQPYLSNPPKSNPYKQNLYIRPLIYFPLSTHSIPSHLPHHMSHPIPSTLHVSHIAGLAGRPALRHGCVHRLIDRHRVYVRYVCSDPLQGLVLSCLTVLYIYMEWQVCKSVCTWCLGNVGRARWLSFLAGEIEREIYFTWVPGSVGVLLPSYFAFRDG